MMCPQLFINYKLKSVAHLPWKTFTYKALNTFIDDLFSFIMKMPLMHRISCFRDGKLIFKKNSFHSTFQKIKRYYLLNLSLSKMDLPSRLQTYK